MSTVFLDTVGLLALWDVADQWHAPAEEAFADLVAEDETFVTTPHILLECGNAAARKPYRHEIYRLRMTLLARGELIDVTHEEVDLAWESYQKDQSSRAGIVDHISFVVMRRLGLTRAFTHDKHFANAGFEVLF